MSGAKARGYHARSTVRPVFPVCPVRCSAPAHTEGGLVLKVNLHMTYSTLRCEIDQKYVRKNASRQLDSHVTCSTTRDPSVHDMCMRMYTTNVLARNEMF